MAWFLAGPQPPHEVGTTIAAAVLVLVGSLLLARAASTIDRERLRFPAAIAGFSVVVPLLLVVVGLDYWAVRNLVFVWVLLALILAAGLGAPQARRIGLAIGGALCALFVAIDVSTATAPKFDRDDWRGAARAVGRSVPGRAIVLSPPGGARTFLLYRPCAELAGPSAERLTEIDLVGLPLEQHAFAASPKPSRPRSVPAPAVGFSERGRRRASRFTVIRFVSPTPRLVEIEPLAFHALSPPGVVLLDRPCRG